MVRVVFPAKVPDGQTFHDFQNTLQERLLESFHATQCGEFKAFVETRRRKANSARGLARKARKNDELSMVHLSDEPEKCYAITHDTVLEAGANLEDLLGALQCLEGKFHYSFEGSAYRVRDFTVRVGLMRHNNQIANDVLVIDIEYRPCMLFSHAQSLLSDFLRRLVPDYKQNIELAEEDAFAQHGLTDVYTASHLALQYRAITKQQQQL